jgi:pimeloyl-ACP methyl ester carboxylesterase
VGAGAGFRLAVRHPDLVRAVVSIDGGVVETALTPGLRSALRFAPFVRFFGAGGRIRRRIASGVAEASGDTAWLTPDVIEAYTKGSSGAQERVLRAMGSAREPEPLEPNLARIRCPVLLLTGTAGSVAAPSVEEVARMRARLPSLAVERVAGAGHYIQEERPEVVVQAIERMDRGTRAALAGEAGPPAAAVRPGPWKEE